MARKKSFDSFYVPERALKKHFKIIIIILFHLINVVNIIVNMTNTIIILIISCCHQSFFVSCCHQSFFVSCCGSQEKRCFLCRFIVSIAYARLNV